jgi:hypothetical protein
LGSKPVVWGLGIPKEGPRVKETYAEDVEEAKENEGAEFEDELNEKLVKEGVMEP